MTQLVRLCPKCGTEREPHEIVCSESVGDGTICGFSLFNIKRTKSRRDLVSIDTPVIATDSAADDTLNSVRLCPNGHEVEAGDVDCITCGASLSANLAAETETKELPDGPNSWSIRSQLESESENAELYSVLHSETGQAGLLRWVAHGLEPGTRIYRVLEHLTHPNITRLVDRGRDYGRAWEVWEVTDGEALADVLGRGDLPESQLELFISQTSSALSRLEEVNLRHGNVSPCSIHVTIGDEPHFQLSDFSTAMLAEFDLEMGNASPLTRYASPETVVGSHSIASDWWSFGIILLEVLTKGKCFESVNDRAFLLQIIARGVALPDDLSPENQQLLKGLLTRDHTRRWRGSEVRRWLDGEKNIPVYFETSEQNDSVGEKLTLGGNSIWSAADFSLSAATAENWDEAYSLVESGTTASWLAARGDDAEANSIQSIMDERRIPPDARFALALLSINPHLPLVVRGDIISPNRLLDDAQAASVWFERPVVNTLKRLKRETWLVRLAERAQRVRARAEEMGLTLVEERFNVARLAAFEARLETFWRAHRSMFPDARAPGIAALLDRRTLTDEDLILLVCADESAFRSAAEVLDEAEQYAREAGIKNFDHQSAAEAFDLSKRQILDDLSESLGAFKRCGNDLLDAWADNLRLGRRMSLAQLLVLRASDEAAWVEPPHQDYLRNIMGFLQKKILMGVQRGPLIKLQIGRSASRMDLTALGSPDLPKVLLDRLLKRDEQPVRLPTPTGRGDERQKKLKSIVRSSELHRRETGVSALVLAWPLIGFEDKNLSGASAMRLAPAILWPVRISTARSQMSIAFDPDRDPELNPALERILGETVLEEWRQKLTPVLKGEAVNLDDVTGAFSEIADCSAGMDIGPVPTANEMKGQLKPKIISAGAVMLADFPSQAIVEDLRQITARPLAGSALEPLLRLVEYQADEVPKRGGELDRFAILDADPSQEEAVRAARLGAGIKLEGPPGTGKSQTIVNTVTDCIGRGETVVVVCEKQAALEVVHKRLRAEGLGHRVVRIENTQSDRKRLLEELKTQIPHILAVPNDRTAELRTLRAEKAAVVDQLETELSNYHDAVYETSNTLGLSYRQVVSRIASLTDTAAGLSAPELRARLGKMHPSELERIISECHGHLETWYEADFSDPSLSLFRVFSCDGAIQHQLEETFSALKAAEGERRSALKEAAPMSGLSSNASSEEIGVWLTSKGQRLRSAKANVRKRVSQWAPLLIKQANGQSEAEAIRNRLAALIDDLHQAALLPEEREIYTKIEPADRDVLSELSSSATLFSLKRPFLDGINPSSIWARRKARRAARLLGIAEIRSSVETACGAAKKELSLRDARSEYEALTRSLSLSEDTRKLSADELRARALRLLDVLDQAISFAEYLADSPWSEIFWDAVGASQQEWEGAFIRLEAAANLIGASGDVSNGLYRLEEWGSEEWLADRRSEMRSHSELQIDVDAILKALPKLQPYQTFRASQISTEARYVMSTLVHQRARLDAADPVKRAEAMSAFIRREAAHAWAESLRRDTPVLANPPQKVASDIDRLAQAETAMRDINQRYLAHIDPEGFESSHAWSQILNIGGVKARRLRQVFDEGRDLGLLQARPIWLVNPDVASRVFPLEPGLFDVAIFDEASQTRVENAIASLYRAKRAVISGDSKQLPPTAFFGAAVSDDDDDEFFMNQAVGEDADAETAERQRQEQALNRRHVKDCQDLLALSQGVLAERGLTIHYRSAYRELIEFSNAAFYGGQLNIPVNHPEAEIVRKRPIDVVQVDGIYRNQSNSDEADAVVEHLSQLWLSAGDAPPTSGVVTFNLKQAELIEERLQDRAELDTTFRRALERERTRKSDGEDVSFFVRNLENVQGDERDVIVFSTTFGRDSKGTFKRNFGVLTQSGGERRLNVAVTRAKHKVLVLTSMPISDVSDFIGGQRGPTKARDYLQAYLRYAELVTHGELDAARSILDAFDVSGVSDPYEAADQETDALVNHVRAILTAEGYETQLRPLTGAFAVDIAILHPKTGLYCFGVELDGPRHPLLNSARARDLWKPRLLSRQGIHVHRVHSPAWAIDPLREKERLILAAKHAVQGNTS